MKSVFDAQPKVVALQSRLRAWVDTPSEALEYEGRGMDVVKGHPSEGIMLRRLRIIVRMMYMRWCAYTKEYQAGGLIDPSVSPHVTAMHSTPCTTVFEGSFFGLLGDSFKVMGRVIAPWRAMSTAISRANKVHDMPLMEDDVLRVTKRAKAVENAHVTKREFVKKLSERKSLKRARDEGGREK